MTIYKVTITVERERFMERPLRFTEEMNVIADSYDQAIRYVRERFVGAGQKEIDLKYERAMEVRALFDVRDGKENIIV